MPHKHLRRHALLAIAVATAPTWLLRAQAADGNADIPGDAIDPRSFGAVNDGVADDTLSLSQAFEQAVSESKPIVLSGRYRISRPILAYKEARAAGGLFVYIAGSAHIAVSRQADPFGDVLYVHTKAACDCRIWGGKLSVDGANRAGRGISVRHNAESGGRVEMTSGLELRNFYELDEREMRENQALLIYGAFDSVDLRHVQVDGVRRINPAASSKGIGVAGYKGKVKISDCTVKDIRVPSIGSADADGIAVFAYKPPDFYSFRTASAVLVRCTLIDCQGRSIKSQCSDTQVIDAVVHRQHAVSIRQAVEFDFQVGNGVVVNPSYHYKSAAGRSPLGASHSCIAFQQLQRDKPMLAKAIGGQLHTDVSVPRYVAAIFRNGSAYSDMQIEGLRVVAQGRLDNGAIHRALVELDTSQVAASNSRARIAVSKVHGPLYCPIVGYHSYSGQDIAAKLSVDVRNCSNELSAMQRRLVSNLSGERIRCLPNFYAESNRGFADAELSCA